MEMETTLERTPTQVEAPSRRLDEMLGDLERSVPPQTVPAVGTCVRVYCEV
jgi:hypothetical protein